MTSVIYKDVPYYVAGNEGSKIGIIVIQEWWGLNNHIKNMTARFAKELNALAITPDLYRGKVATAADEANHLMGSLDWPNAIVDVKNACEYLKEKGCEKIGITGFCMGGALTIASAVHVPAITAGSCFYGIPPAQLANPAEIKIPIQFHFGDKDMSPGFSDIKAADDLKEVLTKAGKLSVSQVRHDNGAYTPIERKNGAKIAEFHRYTNGNHAFMNEEAPAYPFDPELSKLAMKHTTEFFKTYLQ
ncbi:hypothetical protein HDV04_000418 [Boothiomyces sp. JEL0838]|nr:hypothetical protein HDV04_000398 [Boothiomyces sp. JEL0838]KAJ3314456.1 hypothetical protein HDV04_000418 [Boothiomyces sp. JEL0838]